MDDDSDPQAPPELCVWAADRGVTFRDDVTYNGLARLIFYSYRKGGDVGRAEFFIWEVLRDRDGYTWTAPADSGIDADAVADLATRLAADPRVAKSLGAFTGPWYRFERAGVDTYRSRSTVAYKAVVAAIRDEGIGRRAMPFQTPPVRPAAVLVPAPQSPVSVPSEPSPVAMLAPPRRPRSRVLSALVVLVKFLAALLALTIAGAAAVWTATRFR